jgi:hypothetical protein
MYFALRNVYRLQDEIDIHQNIKTFGSSDHL